MSRNGRSGDLAIVKDKFPDQKKMAVSRGGGRFSARDLMEGQGPFYITVKSRP